MGITRPQRSPSSAPETESCVFSRSHPIRRPLESARTEAAIILASAMAVGPGLVYLPADVVQEHMAAVRLARVLADWAPLIDASN
jgi:hypothetical protein